MTVTSQNAPFSIRLKAGDDMDILRNGKIIEFQLNNERTLDE